MYQVYKAVLASFVIVVPAVLAADFNDDDYHEYIVYNVDTADIDILIVPAASPYYARDLRNIENSIEMWRDGIQEMAPSWLAQGIDIEYYTLGYDTPPLDVLWDPEIIIVSGEVNPVLLAGIGLQVPTSWCHGLGPFDASQVHQHDGSPWGVLHGECEDGGKQCVVLNTNFLSTPNQNNEIYMFDLNSHELGHCLGIGHVGDALDFSARNYPREDIMSYQHSSSHVHCVSSLNIKALEAVYGALLGHPELHQHAGSYVHMSPSQYRQSSCSNPQNPAWTDVGSAIPILGHSHD